MRARNAVAAVLAASLALGCIDTDIPPRPTVDPNATGPVELASGSGCGGLDLYVSGGVVYWTERLTGTVKSVPTRGGSTTVLATGQIAPGAITADVLSIYWVSGNAIMKKAIAGGAPTLFVPATTEPENLGGENAINALLADAGTLYYGRYIYAYSIPIGGGMKTPLLASPEQDRGKPGAFALDATHLYQTEMGHGAISRETLDGMQNGLTETGAMQPLAPDRIAVSVMHLLTDAISVVDGKVIWAAGPNINSKFVDQNEFVTAGLEATSMAGNDITGFVISGDVIYFGESVTNTVQMAPLLTGIPTVIATNQTNAGQFHADDKNVFWRTDECRIVRYSK
ncbi:MAG TPA: hypothetical protein VHJ20_24590 [Polyangia bacterium]|nr:hypothetical protein [Polyangia bacterium]